MFSDAQLSGVITRSNIVRYNIKLITWTSAKYQSDAGSTKDTPYRARYGVSFISICENIDRVMTAPPYIV